jgi:hypothetical protein
MHLANADVIYRGHLDDNDKLFPSTHDHPVMKRITEKCISEVSFNSDDQQISPDVSSKR